MSYSHYSNINEEFDWVQYLDDQNNKENRMFIIEHFPACITSIEIGVFFDTIFFDRLILALPKLINLKSITIECGDQCTRLQVEPLFNTFKAMSSSLSAIDYQITIDSIYIEQMFESIQLNLISSLTIIIYEIKEKKPNNFFAKIEQCTALHSLKLEVKTFKQSIHHMYDIYEKYDKQSYESTYNQIMSVANSQKLKSLQKFSVSFSKDISLRVDDLCDLAKYVSRNRFLNELSIQVKQPKIELKSFERFLEILIKESLFKLREISLDIPIMIKPSSIALLRQFFDSQKETLERIHLSSLLYTINQFDSMLKSNATTLPNLKQIDYDLLSNTSLKYGGVIPFSESLNQLKSSLLEVNFASNSKLFSDESILTLGKQLSTFVQLKKLSLKLRGKISDETMHQFAQNVATIQTLQHLFINLSDERDFQNVNWSSNDSGKSIFETDQPIKLKNEAELFDQTADFHQLIINLVLATKTTHSTSFSIRMPSLGKIRSSLEEIFLEVIEKFVLSRLRQKSIEWIQEVDFTFSIKPIQSLLITAIEQNSETLQSIEIDETDFIDLIRIALIPTKSNLLKLIIYNIDFKREYKILDFHPNLIELGFIEPMSHSSPYLITPEQFIQSNLTRYDFCREERERMKAQQYEICSECIKKRKETLFSIIVFERFIAEDLMYKPQYMILDLFLQY